MKIYYSPRFERQYKKLPSKLQDLADARQAIFSLDTNDPLLRVHKLAGNWEGYWSFSVSFSYRIVFKFLDNGDVRFYQIGSHDIYG